MSSRVRFSFVLWWITSYCGNMNNATAARIRTSFAGCFERRVEPQLNVNGVHLVLAAVSGTQDDGDAPQNTPAFTEQICSMSDGDRIKQHVSKKLNIYNWDSLTCVRHKVMTEEENQVSHDSWMQPIWNWIPGKDLISNSTDCLPVLMDSIFLHHWLHGWKNHHCCWIDWMKYEREVTLHLVNVEISHLRGGEPRNDMCLLQVGKKLKTLISI